MVRGRKVVVDVGYCYPNVVPVVFVVLSVSGRNWVPVPLLLLGKVLVCPVESGLNVVPVLAPAVLPRFKVSGLNYVCCCCELEALPLKFI